MHRRHFLLGTTGALAGWAGCSALASQPVMLDLVVFNHAESRYTVEFELFRTDGGSSEPAARLYGEQVAVEPREDVDEPSTTRREAVAEARPCIVRYDVYRDNSTPTDEDHVHFFPTGDGDDDDVAFDIYDEGILKRR